MVKSMDRVSQGHRCSVTLSFGLNRSNKQHNHAERDPQPLNSSPGASEEGAQNRIGRPATAVHFGPAHEYFQTHKTKRAVSVAGARAYKRNTPRPPDHELGAPLLHHRTRDGKEAQSTAAPSPGVKVTLIMRRYVAILWSPEEEKLTLFWEPEVGGGAVATQEEKCLHTNTCREAAAPRDSVRRQDDAVRQRLAPQACWLQVS